MQGKWGVRVHQTQEMKGKEGTGDQAGQDAKSGRYSSRSGLCPSGENGFFADDGGRAGCLVNSKGIIEVTVGCRLRKKRRRMAADRSGWKRTHLGRQRWEGSRDGRRTRATARSRQQASRREVKGVDTRGRHYDGVGPQQARRTLCRESGASGCTRHKR